MLRTLISELPELPNLNAVIDFQPTSREKEKKRKSSIYWTKVNISNRAFKFQRSGIGTYVYPQCTEGYSTIYLWIGIIIFYNTDTLPKEMSAGQATDICTRRFGGFFFFTSTSFGKSVKSRVVYKYKNNVSRFLVDDERWTRYNDENTTAINNSPVVVYRCNYFVHL